MKTLCIAMLLLLTGCASTGSQQMSAEQLKAVAADKNFSAVCSTIIGPWGTGKFVFVNVDRTVVVNGTIAVDANCLVTMSNDVRVPAGNLVMTPAAPPKEPAKAGP